MKRVCTLILSLLLAVSMLTPSLASANSREGKQVFREKCYSCHKAGAEGGQISPDSKTQRQWRRFFKRDQHRDLPKIWESLSREEKSNLWFFIYENALDADKPATCG